MEGASVIEPMVDKYIKMNTFKTTCMFRGIAEEGCNLESITHRCQQGRLRRRGKKKGGDRTWEYAIETSSRRGTARANMDLGSRLRLVRKQVQVQAMEIGGCEQLSRWTGGPRPEEGRESGEKSGAAQSNGGGWGGSWNTEGESKDTENSGNGVTGIDKT